MSSCLVWLGRRTPPWHQETDRAVGTVFSTCLLSLSLSFPLQFLITPRLPGLLTTTMVLGMAYKYLGW